MMTDYNKGKLPLSLWAVALACIISGIFAATPMMIPVHVLPLGLFRGVQVLAIPIGFGLLRLNNKCRLGAMTMTYFQIASLTASQLVMAYGDVNIQWTVEEWSGLASQEVPRACVAVLMAIFIAAAWTLHRPEIRAIFQDPVAVSIARAAGVKRDRVMGPVVLFIIVLWVVLYYAAEELRKIEWHREGHTHLPMPAGIHRDCTARSWQDHSDFLSPKIIALTLSMYAAGPSCL